MVRSLKDRVQSRLKASVAEVGGLDQHQRAVIAVAVVSNEAARVDELLSSAASMAGTLRDAILTDRVTEIIAFGDQGRGLGVMQGDRFPAEPGGDPGAEPTEERA